MCHADAPAVPNAQPVERQEVRVRLDSGEELPALLASPQGGAPAPGVLVVPDVLGRSPFYEDLGERLAAAGYHALVVEYFFRQGPLAEVGREAAFARRASLDDLRALEDLSQAVDWLGARCEGDRVGTVGFCMGGTYVLNLAARRGDLASVCFYGFPQPRMSSRVAPGPAPLDQLDQVHGPLLGFWGDQDAGVGMDNVAALMDGLAARAADADHVIYPGAGHGFLAQGLTDPGHGAHAAAVDAWQRTLAFYRQHLGAP